MRNVSVSFLGALAAWAIRVLAVLLLLALPVAFVRALGVLIAFGRSLAAHWLKDARLGMAESQG